MAEPKTDASRSRSQSHSENTDATNDTESTNRRNWIIEGAAVAIGGIVAVLPFGIGSLTFLDPWRRQPSLPKSRQQGTAGKAGYLRVTSLGALPVGGAPQRFPIIADKIDAWNFTPDQPIGAVFLQRMNDKEIRCFNATCPHAGCSVSCEGDAYVCPCHNSAFNLDGTKRISESGRENPSPRSMDDLAIDSDKLNQNSEIWVEFKNFYTGIHEKVPKS